MKKFSFLPIVICFMFVACKPKSSLKVNTSDSTSNKGVNMPDLNDITPNNNTASGGGSWSKEYRNKFLQGCITKASEKVSASDAFAYCDCMTTKVEAKYPVETEVDAKLTSADIETMKSGCPSGTASNNNSSNNSSSASWSASDQKEFMDNCTPGAGKSLGQSRANDYCACMLTKIMQEYPNSADAGNMPKNRMSELATQCISK